MGLAFNKEGVLRSLARSARKARLARAERILAEREARGCLPLPRFSAVVLLGEALTDEERAHVDTCSRCQRGLQVWHAAISEG